MSDEPTIKIHGVQLNSAQAMAVRVACTSYLDEMTNNPDVLGDDEHGRRMAVLYRDRLSEVMRIMLA